jgi:hypothetical protein
MLALDVDSTLPNEDHLNVRLSGECQFVWITSFFDQAGLRFGDRIDATGGGFAPLPVAGLRHFGVAVLGPLSVAGLTRIRRSSDSPSSSLFAWFACLGIRGVSHKAALSRHKVAEKQVKGWYHCHCTKGPEGKAKSEIAE